MSVVCVLVLSSVVSAQPPWLKKDGPKGAGPNIDVRIQMLEKQLEVLKKIKDGTFKPGELRGFGGPRPNGFQGCPFGCPRPGAGLPGYVRKDEIWGNRGHNRGPGWQHRGSKFGPETRPEKAKPEKDNKDNK